MNSVDMHILRVFVNETGLFGNPVGIVIDERQEISRDDRQKITRDSGFSECVFVEDTQTGKVSIYNPQQEVNFAGHALVGAAYFITRILNQPIDNLDCKGGHIQITHENDTTWIRAGLIGTPPWNLQELQNTTEVENTQTAYEHTIAWAWIDKEKGIIRARTFAPDWGIPEDEANGSGSMQLAAKAGKPVEIHHGQGSIIYVRPVSDKVVEVGGRVLEDNSHTISLILP